MFKMAFLNQMCSAFKCVEYIKSLNVTFIDQGQVKKYTWQAIRCKYVNNPTYDVVYLLYSLF